MSKLIVEVCEILDVTPHPNADKLDIVLVKGWNVIVVKNAFKKGDKCVYFPPDSILPPTVYNDPLDVIPGRLNCLKYLHQLPKDEYGNRPTGARVTACRLRGSISYGLVMLVDSNFGDDPNWSLGTDVSEYFNVTKFEPPAENVHGDAEKSNSRFYPYTSIEHYGNYPDSLSDLEEVIFTEKIHGCNVRLGLIVENDDEGNCQWKLAAGSHSLRRKEYVNSETRLLIQRLIEQNVIKNLSNVDDVINYNDKFWKVTQIIKPDDIQDISLYKIQCVEVDSNGEKIYKKSSYWTCLTDNVKDLLNYIKDNYEFKEPKHSIMIYGEMYGSAIQDMSYGLTNTLGFKAFDIAINNLYLDYDDQVNLFSKFNVEMVPVLYKGLFSRSKLVEFTSGPTAICAPEQAGKFKGREGIVVKPVKELSYCPIVRGRKILKSVSVDYLSRKNGTEYH